MEIKAFLEAVYGMRVERVATINYQGRKQRRLTERGMPYYIRQADWKKAYVTFRAPAGGGAPASGVGGGGQ